MVMGLPISIHLRNIGDQAYAARTVETAFQQLRTADSVFSPFRHDSVLSRFARGEITLDAASRHLRFVLILAERARDMTDGAFDVRATGQLDPCGLVKGWAAERAARYLPRDHYLNAGGDISIGSPSDPWRIGIEHPEDPTGLLAVLSMTDGAVATSGSAHRGTHIIDPQTGRPAHGIRQVTVVGPRLTTADIWATAIVARGGRIFDSHDPLIRRMVSGGYGALIVADDGTCSSTANFLPHYAADLPRPVCSPLP